MNRLTTEFEGYAVPKEFIEVDEYDITAECKDCWEICKKANNDCRECAIQRCFDKLGEYEDAEEMGLLLRLPCNIGDTIFVIPSKINFKLNVLNGYQNNNKVYAQVVCNFVLTNYGLMINTCDGFCHVRDTERGETWFLTMEEAAAALKKMQEDKNNDE